MYQTIGITLALVLVAGIALIATGWRDRRDPTAPRRLRRHSRPTKISRSTLLLLGAGLAAGAILWTITGWLFTLFLTPALLVGLPHLLGRPDAERQIARLNAMDEWSRNLSSGLTAGAGIEYTIISTPVPEILRTELGTFISRIRNNVSLADALKSLANDLDDHVGDKICAALLLSTTLRGSGLAAVLEALAQDVGDMVARRRKTEAERKGSRTQARWITIITSTMIGGMFLFTNFMDPYRSGGMQIVLLALLTAFGAVLFWMRQVTKPPPQPRFIGTSDRTDRTDLVTGGTR